MAWLLYRIKYGHSFIRIRIRGKHMQLANSILGIAYSFLWIRLSVYSL